MKKRFSKVILLACVISGLLYSTEIANGDQSVGAVNVYPATVEESSQNLNEGKKQNTGILNKTKGFTNKIQKGCSDGIEEMSSAFKNFKQKKANNVKKTETAPQQEETVVNIIATEKNTKKNSAIKNLNTKIKGMSFPKLSKSNKKEKQSKLEFKKNSLTEIEETRNIKKIKEHINNEEYFKHDVKNKLYLDRFSTYGAENEKSTFFEQKDIVENETGDIELMVENGKPIDVLIEEIEQSDPNDADSKPIEISVKDSIGIALAKHPDILTAKLNTEIDRSLMVQAWSAYFPTFSAGINWSHEHTRYHGLNFKYGYNSFYAPQLSAGMLLFDFGKTKTNVDIAKTSYDASRYDLQDSINDLIYEIKSAYYNVLFAQKQVIVYNKTIEDFDLQLQSAQKFFSIGKKPQIDVLIAETNSGNAKLNLVQANNTLENAKVSFANTLGLPEFANFELSESLNYVEYDTDLEELLKDAFNIRPDLQSAEKAVESTYLHLRKAKRSFTPDLTASGGYTYSDVDDSNTSGSNIRLDLSYSNFNFMSLKKEYDIAKKSYEMSLANYESKRQKVYLEVKQAFIDYNNAKEGVKQADLNVQQAKAQHYHATGRYKAGYGDAIEIKDAENTFLNAQLSYYRALLNYNLSLAELERVVGRPVERKTKTTNEPEADVQENSAEPVQEEPKEVL